MIQVSCNFINRYWFFLFLFASVALFLWKEGSSVFRLLIHEALFTVNFVYLLHWLLIFILSNRHDKEKETVRKKSAGLPFLEKLRLFYTAPVIIFCSNCVSMHMHLSKYFVCALVYMLISLCAYAFIHVNVSVCLYVYLSLCIKYFLCVYMFIYSRKV